MATLVLTAAAGAVSNVLGLPTIAAGALTIGAAVAGRFIDNALLSRPTTAEGPRLDNLDVMASAEGAPIPRVFGRVRVSGQVIWATNFEEVITKETTTTGGGGGKGGSRNKTTTITYSYFANVAVALAEGPVSHLGRIWADGEELSLDDVGYRFYRGNDSQTPDPLIEAKEGSGAAPAYRGTSYVVLERLPLEDFGNRLPQFAFEIYRPIGRLETILRAVDIIPGAGEFAYDTTPVRREVNAGEHEGDNKTSSRAGVDWTASINELEALAPAVSQAALVVTWFGTDLRANHCRIEPRVDQPTKDTEPETWSVAGQARIGTPVVSAVGGRPAFGGTPSDRSVVRAIADLKARGIGVMFYPFIMMDIPSGNGRPNPYGGVSQPVYPWRGRITCNPAPGQPGSPDKTAAAGTQIAALVGGATAGHYSLNGSEVVYSGPAEWTLRRMVLHYAMLCVAAGGVDSFVIGSELIGLTQVRDSASTYPFVQALKSLAAEVRAILGPGTKIGYAADWSEYHSHRPSDGSNDVFFNLDPLWADGNIDFVGIDNYMPLSDWRDGTEQLDAVDGTFSPRDPAYLAKNMEGGEYYDWYYASFADRLTQTRTPIDDTAYGKHWVFRQKDIRNWWSNVHVDRPGGVEASQTAWAAQAKPIFVTEFGFPAVDKSANQPNVFIDPKSSESFAPYFSAGTRDDVAQRRALEVFIDHWTQNSPVSTVYGGPMIPADRMYAWAWDARSFPAWPANSNLWADAPNWDRGHWLNVRLGSAPVDDLVTAILTEYPSPPITTTGTASAVDGYIIDRVMSARDALTPLEHAFALDIFERGDSLAISSRLVASTATFQDTDLALSADAEVDAPPVTRSRAQESELAAIARVTMSEPFDDYRSVTVEARMPDVPSDRVSSSTLPAVMAPEIARTLAEEWLHASRSRRERAMFALPPSALSAEPGDVVTIDEAGIARDYRIEEIADQGERRVKAVLSDRALHIQAPGDRRIDVPTPTAIAGAPLFAFLDLPLLTEQSEDNALYLAAHAIPWQQGVAVYRSPSDGGFQLETLVETPAIMGETLTPLASGPLGVWDRANSVDIVISAGALLSLDDLLVLAGSNALAVDTGAGWEVLQFADAELIDTRTYRLSRLLRGQLGTDRLLGTTVAAGARIVVLNADVDVVTLASDKIGIPANWRVGLAGYPFDHASFQTLSYTPAGEGRRPLSPVHARARWDVGTGDIDLTWIRRTRRGGDSWEQAEVPLAEETEAYDLTIRDGGAIRFETSVTAPGFTYSSAQQTVDFGAPLAAGDPLDIEVSQLSASFGRGPALRQVLTV